MNGAKSVVRASMLIAVLGLVVAGPAAYAGFAGTDVFLPSVGQGEGQAGSNWYTTVWVYNSTETAANVQLALYLRDEVNTAPDGIYNETIQPGDTRRYVDAISTLFGIEGFGALRVTSDQNVVVNGRIYSIAAGEGEAESVGQFFAAIPASFALAVGDSTTVVGVNQGDPQTAADYRYNFGLMEVGGGSATVKVTAYDEGGIELGTKDYQLGSFQPMQEGVADVAPGLDSVNAWLEVEVLSGDGKVVAFGSGLANQSNDPSTFEMQFSKSLLGSGGLTLPYSDTGSSSGDLFALENTGSGTAVHAVSDTGAPLRADTVSGWAAVNGYSDTTTGVYAHSNSGSAVDARSDTGTAIRGIGEAGYAGRFTGTVLVEGLVNLTDGTDLSLTGGGGYLLFGEESGANLVFDNNEIMARDNHAASILYLQHEGGDVYVNGAVVHSSDLRLKRDVQGLELGLDEVMRLRPVSYEWANRGDDRRLGLIAQEVRDVVSEVVYEAEGGMLGVAYESLVPVLVKAIQEQQADIERLSGELEELRCASQTP